jgi:hypothetical protein
MRTVADPYLKEMVRNSWPQPEEVPVSFASEPGRDDGNLPPVNIVIPDDARELERDVLAYHRELRAQRRRRRLMRLFGPFTRREFGGHAAILPLIATCVALSMLAGAMLSVVTISPASAPTLANPPQASAGPAAHPADLTILPTGTVQLGGNAVLVQSLVRSALALVPAGCDCGPALQRLAAQATLAHVGLYFVGSGAAIPQLAGLTAQYGSGAATAVHDTGNVLGAAYHPVGLTVLLVYKDATARVHRDLPPTFQLGPALRELKLRGSQAPS